MQLDEWVAQEPHCLHRDIATNAHGAVASVVGREQKCKRATFVGVLSRTDCGLSHQPTGIQQLAGSAADWLSNYHS